MSMSAGRHRSGRRRRKPQQINDCYNVDVALDRCDLLCLDLPRAERLRAERIDLAAAGQAAARAKALGDPTRVTIALALRDGEELCVCDLAWVVERAENLVSHHVRLLRTAGLVSSRREGKMVMYSLTDAGRSLLHAVVAQPAVA
jgi:ArsR family transcriptional regulator, lead/cadmium/zinc/bismuth-responsive transcriptional repressor